PRGGSARPSGNRNPAGPGLRIPRSGHPANAERQDTGGWRGRARSGARLADAKRLRGLGPMGRPRPPRFSMATPTLSPAAPLVPARRFDKLGIVLALLVVAGAGLLPFVTSKPNRIVPGESLSILGALPLGQAVLLYAVIAIGA